MISRSIVGKKIKLIHSYDRFSRIKSGDIGIVKSVSVMEYKHGGINAKRAKREDHKIIDANFKLAETGEDVSMQLIEGFDIYEMLD